MPRFGIVNYSLIVFTVALRLLHNIHGLVFACHGLFPMFF